MDGQLPNRGLLDLPAEVQRLILRCIFSGAQVGCNYGPPIDLPSSEGESDNEVDFAKLTLHDRYGEAIVSDVVPIYKLNEDETLRLTQYKYIFDPEARLSWEPHVTFYFPTTVAMLDVLLGPAFPVARRALIRKLVVHGYPLPLYVADKSSYTTHSFHDALRVIEGLRLDSLHYHDVYLPNDDGWGRMAYPTFLGGLPATRRWHELKVFSPDPKLEESEVQHLTEEVQRLNSSTEDSIDFQIHVPVKIQTDDRASPSDILRRGSSASFDVENDSHESEVLVMSAHRSIQVRTTSEVAAQHDWGFLPDLLIKMSWHELRKEGSFLVSEGVDDPCAHL